MTNEQKQQIKKLRQAGYGYAGSTDKAIDRLQLALSK